VATQPTCAVPTGTITITASGASDLEYSINGGVFWQTNNVFSGLTYGSYYIRVRSASKPDCWADYTGNPIVINREPLPPCISDVDVTQPTCSVPTGSIKVNMCCCTNTFEYSKDNGDTWQDSPLFTGLTAGPYIIVVRSKSDPTCETNCIINPVIINPAPSLPVITGVVVTQPTCASPLGSIVVNATVTSGTIEYSKDGGLVWQDGNTFSGLLSGNYYIKVRTKGYPDCVVEYTGNPVRINPVPSTACIDAPVVTQPDCILGSGSIEIRSHCSNSAVEYSIGSGWQDSPMFTGLVPGSYTLSVRVKGDITCVASYSGNPVVINAVPAMPSITGVTLTQPTCASPTGTITVTATLATGTMEYSINGGLVWQDSNIFGNLLAGNYYIKVRTKGHPTCVATYANNPVIINPVPVPPCIGAPVVTQPDCINGFGTIEVKALCCTTPMEYRLTGANARPWQDSPVFTNLLPGSYNIEVRSKTDNTCITIYTGNPVIINAVPVKPVITGVTVTQPDCEQTTGQIVITATGSGAMEYSISGGGSWQPGGTFSNLSPGSYAVRVRLAGHPTCYVDATAYAVVNPLPTPPAAPVATVTQPTCQVTKGTITVT
jgi:hypothetical protein